MAVGSASSIKGPLTHNTRHMDTLLGALPPSARPALRTMFAVVICGKKRECREWTPAIGERYEESRQLEASERTALL